MGLVDKIKNAALIIGTSICLNSGCKNFEGKPDYPMWALPVNAAVGYIGALTIHEGAHALTAKIAGSKTIQVSLLPTPVKGGVLFGETYYGDSDFSNSEEILVDSSGPFANLSVGIIAREILKTGYVPPAMQPTLAWYAAANKIATYYNGIKGIAGKGDLGHHNIGIAFGFLAAQLGYDFYDLFYSNDEGKFVDVLTGKDFYERPKKGLEVVFDAESNGSLGVYFSYEF